MTHAEKVRVINQSIIENKNARIHFPQRINRLPLYGEFVKLADFDELLSKRMVRFVTGSKQDNFALTKSPYFTRIINIEDIENMKLFSCV